MMKRLLTITVLLIMVMSFGVETAYGQSSESKNLTSQKPNIVLIMTDDQGLETIGTYGGTYDTPALDKLAKNGVKFVNMHSQPICTPSRVKLMTGKHNFRNYTDFGYLNPDETTFGNIFQDAGYNTLIAGKWQLNGIYKDKKPGWDNINRPYHFGFDEYILWQVTKDKTNGERYANPLLIQNGEELPRNENEYGPDVISNYVLDFIDRMKDKKQPFFVYYPMNLPHDPFVPTPDSPEWHDSSKRYDDDTRYFKDMIAYIDKIVNRIMDKLEQSGLSENTLVIFTADNGTSERIVSKMKNEDLINGKKGYMVDRGTRVPLITYWKDKSLQGSVNTDLIDFSDFLPTLLDAANISPPANKVIDGQSFLPQITGDPVYNKEYIYMYYKPDWGQWNDASGVYARTENYKLYGDGRFYDTSTDAEEKNNIPLKELQGKVLETREKLQNILDQKPVIPNNKP